MTDRATKEPAPEGDPHEAACCAAAAFHVSVADIVRQYLAGRYALETNERTTTEILHLVETGARPLPVVRRHLTDVLSQCDLVKFARFVPEEEEAIGTVDTARLFVEETRPAPVTAVGDAPQAESA